MSLKEYLKDKSILVLDASAPSRANLAKTIIEQGAQTAKVLLVGDDQAALEQIEKLKPPVLFIEYMIGKRPGLEIVDALVKHYPQAHERLVVMVTSNTSESAVAEASEGDVDAFVLKPYTQKNLIQTITAVVETKIKPNEYSNLIENGKMQIKEGKFKEALQTFDQAVALHPKPSLALFYKGQVELLERLLDQSEESYKSGLKHNEIHYKCLTGLFELLLQREKYQEAYGAIQKIAKVFPANPTRFNQILRLAIATGNFDDLESLYETFKNLEIRTDEQIKHVCAGLIVAGKHAFKINQPEKGMKLIKNAAVSSAGNPSILKEVVIACCDFGEKKDAVEFLKRFPESTLGTPEFLTAKFYLDHIDMDPKLAITEGKKMLVSGIKDPAFLMLLLRVAKKSGDTQTFDFVLAKAIEEWPRLERMFKNN